MTRPAVHQLAAIANAAALFVLVLLSSSPSLLEGSASADRASAPATLPDVAPVGRAVLVVIDGLRADTAAKPGVMPFMAHLGDAGGMGTARVDALVPSTVAGIVTLTSGVVPPPVKFASDFAARPARDGGLFEQVARRGESSFVAGPRLWNDLYGRRIRFAGSRSFRDDDAAALKVACAALSDRSARLVVVHFTCVDCAAHAFGGASAEYAAAAGWCDWALRALARNAGRDTLLVITSDHGMTSAGGHAGREPSVVVTPVVLYGPGVRPGERFELHQHELHDLLSRALRLPAATPKSASAIPAIRWCIGLACAFASLLAWLHIARGIFAGGSGRPHATLLNIGLWVILALLITGHFMTAGLVGSAVLLASARLGPSARVIFPKSSNATLVLGMAVGSCLALCRIADGWLQLSQSVPAHAAAWQFAAALLAGFTIGDVLRRFRPAFPFASAIALIVAGVLLERALLQTASLSSIDLRLAFRAAEGPLGISAAIAVVLLLQSLPTAALLLGFAPGLRELSPRDGGRFYAGLFSVIAGEIAASAVVLTASAQNLELGSLALGCFLRGTAELLWWGLGLAGVLLWPRRLAVAHGAAGATALAAPFANAPTHAQITSSACSDSIL